MARFTPGLTRSRCFRLVKNDRAIHEDESELPEEELAPEAYEIERAFSRFAYLSTRARRHGTVMDVAGLKLDRASVALLRRLAESEALRATDLASVLGVEHSHITRQTQQLMRSGHVTRLPDPDNHRAYRLRLTGAGRDTVERATWASTACMQLALHEWTAADLASLADLLHRMVDDFLAHGHAESTDSRLSDSR